MKFLLPLLLSGAVATSSAADNPFALPPGVWLVSAAGMSAVVAGGVRVGGQKTSHVALQSASGLLGGAALGGLLYGGLTGLSCAISDDGWVCDGLPPGAILLAATLGMLQGHYAGIKLHSKWTGIPGNDKAAQGGVYLGTLAGVLLAVALWPEHETHRYQRRNLLVPIALTFPNLGGVLGFNMKVGGLPQAGAREGEAGLALDLEKSF